MAATPTVLGRVIRINEVPATIVGVMPEGMKFPNADLWQALAPDAEDDKRDERRFAAFGGSRRRARWRRRRRSSTRSRPRLAREHPDDQ